MQLLARLRDSSGSSLTLSLKWLDSCQKRIAILSYATSLAFFSQAHLLILFWNKKSRPPIVDLRCSQNEKKQTKYWAFASFTRFAAYQNHTLPSIFLGDIGVFYPIK